MLVSNGWKRADRIFTCHMWIRACIQRPFQLLTCVCTCMPAFKRGMICASQVPGRSYREGRIEQRPAECVQGENPVADRIWFTRLTLRHENPFSQSKSLSFIWRQANAFHCFIEMTHNNRYPVSAWKHMRSKEENITAPYKHETQCLSVYWVSSWKSRMGRAEVIYSRSSAKKTTVSSLKRFEMIECSCYVLWVRDFERRRVWRVFWYGIWITIQASGYSDDSDARNSWLQLRCRQWILSTDCFADTDKIRQEEQKSNRTDRKRNGNGSQNIERSRRKKKEEEWMKRKEHSFQEHTVSISWKTRISVYEPFSLLLLLLSTRNETKKKQEETVWNSEVLKGSACLAQGHSMWQCHTLFIPQHILLLAICAFRHILSRHLWLTSSLFGCTWRDTEEYAASVQIAFFGAKQWKLRIRCIILRADFRCSFIQSYSRLYA